MRLVETPEEVVLAFLRPFRPSCTPASSNHEIDEMDLLSLRCAKERKRWGGGGNTPV
jgi:hypothetical protein